MKKILLVPLLIAISASVAIAAGSQKSSAPETKSEIRAYNKGVDLLMKKKFDRAEKQFRKAIDKKEAFAEAHNNLAYALRKQGPKHYDEALKHYNRAIALNGNLPEPYMYRGVLHTQMGNYDAAASDLQVLAGLQPKLAEELRYVIDNRREKEPEQFFGVTQRLN